MRAEEKAQRLRAMAAFPDNLGLILSIHMMAHNWLQLQFQGIQDPVLVSVGMKHTYSTQAYMQMIWTHRLHKIKFQKHQDTPLTASKLRTLNTTLYIPA